MADFACKPTCPHGQDHQHLPIHQPVVPEEARMRMAPPGWPSWRRFSTPLSVTTSRLRQPRSRPKRSASTTSKLRRRWQRRQQQQRLLQVVRWRWVSPSCALRFSIVARGNLRLIDQLVCHSVPPLQHPEDASDCSYRRGGGERGGRGSQDSVSRPAFAAQPHACTLRKSRSARETSRLAPAGM